MQFRGQKCAYCLRRIFGLCILCNQCSQLRLCLECFLSGVEGGPHKNCHSYIIEKTDSTVQDRLFGPVFPNESVWYFHEELKLMDAVETYGYGNWSEIASCITNRTPAECKVHYDRFYVTGLIGSCAADGPTRLLHRVIDHTEQGSFEQSPLLPHISPDNQIALGYMPCRDEFECEYMNNAESLITTIPFGNTSDGLYRELHLSLVDIYNHRLEARLLRHSVAREHDLVTHLMRDLRSGHESCQLNQSFRRACGRGGRSVFRHRSIDGRRRKPGHTRRSKFTDQREKTHFQRTDAVTKSEQCIQIPSPDAVTHVVGIATGNANHFSINKVLHEDVKPAFGQLAHPDKQHSRSFENLCASGDYVSVISEESTVRATQPLSNDVNMGNQTSEFARSKLSGCGTECSFSCALTHCPHLPSENGSTSSENTDSGVFSGESCAQSTVSSVSTILDMFTSSSIPTATAPLGFIRRPRSRSDSFDPASLTKMHGTKPSDLLASLVELRQPEKPVNHIIAPVQSIGWIAEEISNHKSCGLLNSPKPEKLVSTHKSAENVNADKRRDLLIAACVEKSHENYSSHCPKNIGHGSNSFAEYRWLKPFARFLTKSEMENLTDSLSRERQLRSEIEQLLGHHKRGTRSMKDICLKPTIRIIRDSGVYIHEKTKSVHRQSFIPMNALLRKRVQKLGALKGKNLKVKPTSSRPRGRPRKLNKQHAVDVVHRGQNKNYTKSRKPGPGRPRTRL